MTALHKRRSSDLGTGARSCSPSKPASLLLPLTAGTSLECCSRLRTQRGRPIPDRTARYTSTRWTGRFPIDALGDTLNMAWTDDGQVMASVVRLRAALWKFPGGGEIGHHSPRCAADEPAGTARRPGGLPH